MAFSVALALYVWNAFLSRAAESPSRALPPAHTLGLAFQFKGPNSTYPPSLQASDFSFGADTRLFSGSLRVGLEDRAGRVPPGVLTVAVMGSYFGDGTGWRSLVPGDGFASCTQPHATRCVFTTDATRADAVVAHNFDVLYPWTLLSMLRLRSQNRCCLPMHKSQCILNCDFVLLEDYFVRKFLKNHKFKFSFLASEI